MMNLKKNNCHVLLVSYPILGHINPCLQFAKRLVNLGVQVTYCTSLSGFNRISNLPTIKGLSFAPFSDGYDGGFKGSFDEYHLFCNSLKTYGSEFVINMVSEHTTKKNLAFTRIIYTTLMAWVGSVAKIINVPSTLFWIQPVTILDIYYYYFTDYADSFKNCPQHQSLELPGLPLALNPRDFPSFVFTNVKYNDWATQSIKEHIQLLNSEENPRVLVNTFDALEFDALKALKDSVTMVGVGPCIPSTFLEEKDRFDTSFGSDLQSISKNYIDWLDEKPNESVIYIAFGSYAEISNQLMEEIAQGLLKSGRPFLWVIRKGIKGENPKEKLRCKEELEKQGKIVTWCSQVEVLHHPSVGCFLTHCGWNSTLESLASGVPIVACPLWNDQLCNAKLIQDVWKIGVRVSVNDEGIVEKDDFERCIDVVMKGEECRNNAKKWKDLDKEVMKENGSSNLNMQAYVNEILLGHS
ncbi:UDP-glycosyltransferase 75C1-like [Solanum lycopersicum]|uniref:UDP-glycosyltransferase 75C1-like n=1 Tax=Solanum lycopersicum TaxID=4081 RepID=UPI003749E259